MDKILLLYTMKGCPFCTELKQKLEENEISFYERDIHENEEEYDMFSKITENDFVPAFMIVESPEIEPNSLLFAPGRDFDNLDEGVGIIKEHFGKNEL